METETGQEVAGRDGDVAPSIEGGVDSGPPRWCVGEAPGILANATFCDDFDVDPLEPTWQFDPAPAAAVGIDPAAYRASSPRSVRFVFNASGNASRAKRTGPALSTQGILDFSVRKDALDGDISLLMLYTKQGDGTLTSEIDLQLASSGALILNEFRFDADGGITYVAHNLTATLTSTWAHVRLELSPGQSQLRVITNIDGNTKDEILSWQYVPPTRTQTELALGPLTYGAQHWDFHFDDVLVRMQ
jgi:hypothetical protein